MQSAIPEVFRYAGFGLGNRSPQNIKLRGKLCYEMLLWRQSASEFWRLFAWLSAAQRQVLSLLVSVIGRGQRHEQETVSTRLLSKMQCMWRNAMQHISVSGKKTELVAIWRSCYYVCTSFMLRSKTVL